VGLLARILQFIAGLVLFIWAWQLLTRWLFQSAAKRRVEPFGTMRPKPLHRDPVCGTWVSPEISYTLDQASQTFHFCSAECRERFRAGRRAAGE
jgi:YHS domain-containing protein